MSNFNLFKSVFGNVATLAKAMDNNIDKFCDAILTNLKQHYDFDSFTEEGEYEEFKEKVIVKAFEVFADFKIKVKKPKTEVSEEEKKKKKTNGFILFNIEKREQLKKDNAGMSFENIGKIVGDEWAKLSEEEKEEYNKKAAEVNGVEYKKVEKKKNTLPTCSHEDCGKKVKGEAVDGVFLCADHKKQKDKKPIKICAHIKKGGIQCSTTVKDDQDFCSKHKEKTEEKEEKKVEEKKEKKPKKKIEEEEEEIIPKAKVLASCSFKFDKERPVPISNKEFWVTQGVKGTNERANVKTGVVTKTEGNIVKFVGILIKGDLYEEEDLPTVVIDWVEKCGISTHRKPISASKPAAKTSPKVAPKASPKPAPKIKDSDEEISDVELSDDEEDSHKMAELDEDDE
jgi:hypothetical protein